MKVIVAGTWTPDMPVGHVLGALAEGMRHETPSVQTCVLPFGGAHAWTEACRTLSVRTWTPGTALGGLLAWTAPREERTSAAAGRLLSWWWGANLMGMTASTTAPPGAPLLSSDDDDAPAATTLVIEGGHDWHPDAGRAALNYLGARMGWPLGHERADAAQTYADALTHIAHAQPFRGVTVLASTRRPLVGMASVLAVDPDVRPRSDVDPGWARDVVRAFEVAWAARPGTLPLMDTYAGHAHRQAAASPAALAGSGAASGLGALIALGGGTIEFTEDWLARAYALDHRMDDADLLVITEPVLDDPVVAESHLSRLSGSAGRVGIPVVVVGQRSSLSRHEAAEWGLHGVMETGAGVTGDDLVAFGRRVARTWVP